MVEKLQHDFCTAATALLFLFPGPRITAALNFLYGHCLELCFSINTRFKREDFLQLKPEIQMLFCYFCIIVSVQ